jgi:predicted secreted hydrolase
MKLLVFLTIVAALGLAACGDGAGVASDAGTDADSDADSDSDTDSDTDADTDTDTDADPDAGAGDCTGAEPFCDGETVVSCDAGVQAHTPCGDGTFCNYGACEESAVVFPDDAAPHDNKAEWWYYTGHVSEGGQAYGFEITIFKYQLTVFQGYMCHVAVLDATAGVHYHNDEISVLPGTWESAPIDLEVGSCHMVLDGAGHDHVVAEIGNGKEKDGLADPWSLDLSFDPQKRPARHGDGGFIPMSDAGGTSWYYSYTRLAADGTITDPDGVAHAVAGLGWMDHQWGEFDPMTEFKGWDWWSVQLDDDYEIMLFQFRDWDDVLTTQAGTILDPDGNQTVFEGLDAFTISPRRSWASPHTDGTYPLDWDIGIVAGTWDLDVLVGVDDQEMYNIAQNYWEGATTVAGTRGGTAVAGVGYTELTGYASDLTDPIF